MIKVTKILVSDLMIYPVKSCRGVKVKHAQVESFGLKNDRRWMIVDAQSVMLTQRKFPKMCLIQPVVTEDGLILNHSDMKSLEVVLPIANKKIDVKVWDDECQGHDAGDEAASWLTQILSTQCRLVYFPDEEIRQVDLTYANAGDKTAFSDGFPFLLISQASLDDLNSRLDKPIPMARFRPNIVVEGCEAYEEDSWKNIQIGDINFRIVKPCSRCVIPSINIDNGEKEDEPIKTLVAYRKLDSKIFFGQNVIGNTDGEIEVGMSVDIL